MNIAHISLITSEKLCELISCFYNDLCQRDKRIEVYNIAKYINADYVGNLKY